MDILSITNKESVSADAKVYTKDGNDFVTTTFDALYKNSSAKTNIEKSVSDANARIDTTNNTVAELDNYARAKANGIVLQSQGEMVTVNDSSDDYVVNLKPYGKSEQSEEPSPDYPQEIRSTVISEIKTVGKNWLKNTATSQTSKGITFTVNKDKSITVNGISTDRAQLDLGTNVLPAGSYIMSQGHAINYSVCIFASYKVNGESKYIDLDSAVGGERSFTLDSETSVSFKADVRESNRNISNITLYPMIRKADIADATYEPYTETVAQLSEPITLYGIATTSGGNFTDSNGQQWIADYIDTASGKVVRNAVKLNVYDETVYDWGAESYWHDFYILREQYDTTNYIARTIPAICNKLSYTEERIAPSFYYRTHNMGWDGYARIGFRVPSNVNTVDLFKEYLGEDCEIILPLKDPTVEDLSTADVVALKNLKTFYGVTNVTNDSEVKGEMVLSYNADTKMYIDNKFAELAAQLV